MDKDLKNLLIVFLIVFGLIMFAWHNPFKTYKGGSGGGAETSVNFDGQW